jgi:hypothetical protein
MSAPPAAKQDMTALTRLATNVLGPRPRPEEFKAAKEILDSVVALGRELSPTEHRRVIERLEAIVPKYSQKRVYLSPNNTRSSLQHRDDR